MKTRFSRTARLALALAALVFSKSIAQKAEAGNFTDTGPLNVARNRHTATLLADGRVLVVGGSVYSWQVSSAETFNPATGTWTATGSLAAQRAHHTATLLANGKVLIAGGWAYAYYLSDSELFVEAAPITLTGMAMLPTGAFQLSFANTSGVSFSAMGATTPLSDLSVLGNVSEISPSRCQFIDRQATNSPQRFYRVRSN